MPVVGQRAAESDVVGVAAGRVLHVEVGLGDGEGLGVHLLAEQVDLGVRVDRGRGAVAVLAQPDRDVLLGDRQHAAGAAARVVDGADDASCAGCRSSSPASSEVDHQVHHVAGREVLAGVLVQRLVELADQLLEDRAHRRVGDPVRVQVDVLEALEHQEEQPRLVQLGDRVVEVELLQHLAHVRAEAGDVVAQVGGQVRRVGEQPLEVVAGRVVEGEARSLAELRVEVLQLLAPQLGLLARAPSAWCGASTQSRRRRTVSGRITSWYLPRLKVSRIRSATPQRKLTISLWFMNPILVPTAASGPARPILAGSYHFEMRPRTGAVDHPPCAPEDAHPRARCAPSRRLKSGVYDARAKADR